MFNLLTMSVTVSSKLLLPMVLSGEFCPELLGWKPTAYALRSSVGENLRKTFLLISIGPSRISTPTHGLADVDSQIWLNKTNTVFIWTLKVTLEIFQIFIIFSDLAYFFTNVSKQSCCHS